MDEFYSRSQLSILLLIYLKVHVLVIFCYILFNYNFEQHRVSSNIEFIISLAFFKIRFLVILWLGARAKGLPQNRGFVTCIALFLQW